MQYAKLPEKTITLKLLENTLSKALKFGIGFHLVSIIYTSKFRRILNIYIYTHLDKGI